MGVTVTTRQAGDGATRPRKGDRVVVHYVGSLENGVQFDSSRERGIPFEFNVGVGQVIRGWDEGERPRNACCWRTRVPPVLVRLPFSARLLTRSPRSGFLSAQASCSCRWAKEQR